MFGVKFTLDAISFCTFRIPTATSMVRSYSIPPFTTLRGIISNAKGLERDNFMLQNENLRIGIKSLNHPNKFAETSRILKYIARDSEKRPLRRVFPSSPVKKEILLKPSYDVFLVGSEELIESTYESLVNPRRPLYLGQSDDFVDISNITNPAEVDETISDSVSSIIEGIHPGCEIVRLPYKYILEHKPSISYRTFSLPTDFPYKLQKETACYTFGEEYVTAQ
jgi:CRISPR-associated protein Cas5h